MRPCTPRVLRTALLAALCAVWLLASPAPSHAVDPAAAPTLVVTSPADAFGAYYGEILRAEGINDFDVADASALTPTTLARYQVVLLAPAALSAGQVSVLTAWVQAGGDLVAMRPGPELAGLLGLGGDAGDLNNGYLRVAVGEPPGAGITAESLQFHGTADQWTAPGTTSVATLQAGASTGGVAPAVTLRTVGAGQAAAFTFDLARSVVQTRQGNPAWAGQERDGIAPIRSDDLFFPDWVDFAKIAIPQADEQQRLLVNLMTFMARDRIPLPRFWYLPRGLRAAVVLTGDDHNAGGTIGQFNRFLGFSPPGCSVEDWQCVRTTSYVFPSTPITNAQATAFQGQGFEIAVHLDTGCAGFTDASVNAQWGSQLGAFATTWPGLAAPRTSRTHCIVWNTWAAGLRVGLSRGIRFDTNYYYWPGSWVANRPGLFTGSGFPMRFADSDGSLIDVYQATTQLTDESDIDIRAHIQALLDRALGPEGAYGVFTANMHTDGPQHAGADAIVQEAQRRGVPIVSARQMLDWLDGRNGSTFQGVTFVENALRFGIERAAGARGLQAMIPVDGPQGALLSLRLGASDVATTAQTIKGVRYAVFDAAPGAYVATYDAPPPPGSSSNGTRGAGTPATPAKPAAPKRRVVRLGRAGKVGLRVSCPRSQRRCRITVRLTSGRRTLGRATVRIRGGRSVVVRVRVPLVDRRRLARRGRLSVTAVVVTRGTSGRATTRRIPLTLLPRRVR